MGALEHRKKHIKTFQSWLSNQTDQLGKRLLVRDETKSQTIADKSRHTSAKLTWKPNWS